MAKGMTENISSPDKKTLMVGILSKRLAKEKSEIASIWAKQIRSFGGSYARVSFPELMDLCTEFLDAFVEALGKTKFLKLRTFIEKVSHIRSAQGFRLSEVQRAYYSFYEVIKPLVRQLKMKGKGSEKVVDYVLDVVNSILVDTLFELSEAYHRTLNEKMDDYIDQIEKMNVNLKETSITDELTGCYNRRYFHDILDSEVSRAKRYRRPLAIIIFDIDHFKEFNDKYGHLAGDEILRGIGDILRSSVRITDRVFRYGGEEFCIILPETKEEETLVIAERIRKKISNTPFNVDDRTVKITMSGGVNQFDDKLPDKNSLVANADKALYQAKKQDRNQVVLYGE